MRKALVKTQSIFYPLIDHELQTLIAKAKINKSKRKSKADYSIHITTIINENTRGEIIDFDYKCKDKNAQHDRDFIIHKDTIKKLIQHTFVLKDKNPLSIPFYNELLVNVSNIYYLLVLAATATRSNKDLQQFEAKMTLGCRMEYHELQQKNIEFLITNYQFLIRTLKEFEKELNKSLRDSELFENIVALTLAKIRIEIFSHICRVVEPFLESQNAIDFLNESILLAKQGITAYTRYLKQTNETWQNSKIGILLNIKRVDATSQITTLLGAINSYFANALNEYGAKFLDDSVLDLFLAFIQLKKEIILANFYRKRTITVSLAAACLKSDIADLFNDELVKKFRSNPKLIEVIQELLEIYKSSQNDVIGSSADKVLPADLKKVKLKCFELEELILNYVAEASINQRHAFDLLLEHLLLDIILNSAIYPEKLSAICKDLLELTHCAIQFNSNKNLTSEESREYIAEQLRVNRDPEVDLYNITLNLLSEKCMPFDVFKRRAKDAILPLKQLIEDILEKEQDEFNAKTIERVKHITIKPKKIVVKSKGNLQQSKMEEVIAAAKKDFSKEEMKISGHVNSLLSLHVEELNENPWIEKSGKRKKTIKQKSHSDLLKSDNVHCASKPINKKVLKNTSTNSAQSFFYKDQTKTIEYPYFSFSVFKDFYEQIESSLRAIEMVEDKSTAYQGLKDIQRDLLIADLLYKKQAVNPLCEARMLSLNALHHWYVSRSAAEDVVLRPDERSRFRKILVMTTDVQTLLLSAIKKLLLVVSPSIINVEIMQADIEDTFALIKDIFNLLEDLIAELTHSNTILRVEKAIELFRNFKFSSPTIKAPEELSTIRFRENRLASEIRSVERLIPSLESSRNTRPSF